MHTPDDPNQSTPATGTTDNSAPAAVETPPQGSPADAPATSADQGAAAVPQSAAVADPMDSNTAPAAEAPMTAASLSEFDFYALIDSSGSMGNPSRRYNGRTLWGEAEELALGLTRACAEFDEDGIDIITFAAAPRLFPDIVPEKVHEVFQQVSPMGSTNTHLALQAALDLVSQRNKKAFIICFTDGRPNDPTAVKATIKGAVNTLDDESSLTFLFIQIGQDREAGQFLDDLDDNLVNEGAKFDCVDCITSDVAEQLTPAEMLTKAMND